MNGSLIKGIKALFNTKNIVLREVLLVILGYFLLFIIFFFYDLLHFSFGGDLPAFYLPHYFTFLETLHHGSIPLWFPYSFLGGPELFKLEFGYFYPGTWLIFLTNLIINPHLNLTILGKTMQLSQYLHVIIGSLGIYFLCRKVLNLKLFTSFVAGMLYGFSFYLGSQIGDISSFYAKVYFPFIIAFLTLYLRTNQKRYFVLVLLTNVLLFTFGYPYNYIYIFFAEVVLGFVLGFKNGIKTTLLLLNIALVSLVFILPNAHIISHSYRYNNVSDDPTYHTRFANIPYKIMNIVNPEMSENFYDVNNEGSYPIFGSITWGTSIFVLLLLGFYFFEISPFNLWLLVIFISTLLYSFGGFLGIPGYLGQIVGLFKTLRTHVSILFITFFAGTIILAQGFDKIIQGQRGKSIELTVWIGSGFLLAILFVSPLFCLNCSASSKLVVIDIGKTFVLLSFSLLLLRFFYQSQKKIYLVIILAIAFLETHYYISKIDILHTNQVYRKFYAINELVPELPSKDNLFRYSYESDQFNYNTSPIHVDNLQGYETTPYSTFYTSMQGKSESEYLSNLNVKYLVTTQPGREVSDKNLVLLKEINPVDYPKEDFISNAPNLTYWSNTSTNHHYIYKVKSYLPRFYVPHEAKTCILNNCSTQRNPEQLVYTSAPHINMVNSENYDVHIQVFDYTVNNITLMINSPKRAFIASSEIYDEGWKVKENNKVSVVLNINNGFRGFIVPSGRTTVRMYYTPPLMLEGLLLSIVGIIFAPLTYLANTRLSRKYKFKKGSRGEKLSKHILSIKRSLYEVVNR